MKNKNERRTFINNKWKVILSNILQRATSYRSVIKSNSVSCSRAARSLLQVTNGCDGDDGPGRPSTRWPLYSLSSLLPAAPESSGNSVSFLFCVCCPFSEFQGFCPSSVLPFQSNKQQKLQIKIKQIILSNGGWWEVHKTTDQTTAVSRAYAPTVETRNAPELDWDAPCCDVVSSSLPIQRPANILWWSPSSLNHPPQWWSSWHLLWQLITLPIFRQWQSLFREKLQPIIIWTEEIAIIGSVQSQIDED